MMCGIHLVEEIVFKTGYLFIAYIVADGFDI